MKKKFLLSIAFMLAFSLTNAQNKVVLYGTSQDTSLTRLMYWKNNPFELSELSHLNRKKLSRINNHFKITLHVHRPGIFTLFPVGHYYGSLNVYVAPGDSVSFKIVPFPKKHQYKMIFSGKNAAQYNYAQFMSNAFNYRTQPHFRKGTDLNQYKKALLTYKNNQLDSLKRYFRSHAVSKSFADYAKAEINDEYILSLYWPFRARLSSIEDVPSGYFQNTKPVKNEVSRSYKEVLIDKYFFFFTHSTMPDFDSVYTNIVNNFSGQDREYLYSFMIGSYALLQKQTYQSKLLKAIKEAPKYVHNPQYLSYIQRAKIYYSELNHPFPDSVLAHTYLKAINGNKKISLKELLNHFKGEPIYLDFWASWCGPCRYDIANSHKAKQYLAQKHVAYIYISRDTDAKAWLKASEHDSITKNQYLLSDVPNSPLLKYLNVIYIPRYVLMNAQHDIEELSAPRPAIYNGNTYEFDQLKKCVQKILGNKKTLTVK